MFTKDLTFFIFLLQDGKTAEDLASAEHHEHVVSLLGKLKKVKRKKKSQKARVGLMCSTKLCQLSLFEE